VPEERSIGTGNEKHEIEGGLLVANDFKYVSSLEEEDLLSGSVWVVRKYLNPNSKFMCTR
jgi:hypothetical protein